MKHNRALSTGIKAIAICLTQFPLALHASFIESTIGAAVVDDATASLYNPAGLTRLKNSQVIPLGSVAYFRTQFMGQFSQNTTGFSQSGDSNSQTYYYLPSFYAGIPVTKQVALGVAVVSNQFNRDIEGGSLLRYVQSSNSIQGVDVVPAIGMKINESFSLGAAINFSSANFILKPIVGAPSLNIPDSQSRNQCDGRGVGGDVGLLVKLSPSTVLGFNYRSAVTYRLSGKSVLEGNPDLISDDYHFKFWTPARSVLSASHQITPTFGWISTIQRIQWSIIKQINVHGIATQIGSRSLILDANIPYYLHDSWLFTLGGQYRITSKWVIRLAGTFNQSPSNRTVQISTGNSIILGGSIGYALNKRILIDGSYAHAFIRNENVHITTSRNGISGINKGWRDSVSLKLTFNL